MATNGLRIRDLLPSDRPRERLALLGAQALSTTELLAVLLGSGRPDASALHVAAGLLGEQTEVADLANLGFDELTAIPGVGEAKAARLLAAIELGRRLATAKRAARPRIRGPADVAGLLLPRLGPAKQEMVVVVLLDAQHRAIRVAELYRGTADRCPVRASEVFRPAVLAGAPSLVLAHNHPSGEPEPTPEDIRLTRQLVAAGRVLGISVEDHVVVGAGRYTSLRETGFDFGS